MNKIIQRLIKRVTKTDYCWEWIGCRTEGYGRLRIGEKLYLAHRIMWQEKNGRIPEGLCVLHKCDNRGCINPDHLFIGTKKDNTQDMFNKKRNPQRGGSYSGKSAKLTKDQVIEIRKLYATGDFTQTYLGKKFNVSQRQIGHIVLNLQWRN